VGERQRQRRDEDEEIKESIIGIKPSFNKKFDSKEGKELRI